MLSSETTLAALTHLPHWQHVRSRADKWLQDATAHYQDCGQVDTAAIGAGFFDAHELAVLVKNIDGEFSEYGAARSICASKSLHILPPAPAVEVNRCLATEAHHLQLFLEHHRVLGMTVDSQAEWDANEVSDSWMRFGASHILRTDSDARVLVLLDAPLAADGRLSLPQLVQLHNDRLVAERAGICIDTMVVSKLDMCDWKLSVLPVEHIPRLTEQLVGAGDHYWNKYVQQDLLPDLIEKPDFVLTVQNAQDRERITGLADQMAMLKLIGDTAYGRFKTLEGTLRTELGRYSTGNAMLSLRALKVDAKSSFDSAGAKSLLATAAPQANVDVDDAQLAALIRRLTPHDPAKFITTDYRVMLGKSHALTQLRSELDTGVQQLLQTHLDTLKSVNDLSVHKAVPVTEISTKPARRLAPS